MSSCFFNYLFRSSFSKLRGKYGFQMLTISINKLEVEERRKNEQQPRAVAGLSETDAPCGTGASCGTARRTRAPMSVDWWTGGLADWWTGELLVGCWPLLVAGCWLTAGCWRFARRSRRRHLDAHLGRMNRNTDKETKTTNKHAIIHILIVSSRSLAFS